MKLFFRRIYLYTRCTLKTIVQQPKIDAFISCVIYFPSWWKYLSPKHSSIQDQLPWLGFSSIHFLKKIIRKDMVIYEWGSGGSTLFWSNLSAKVISVEHDKDWYHKVHGIVNDRTNVLHKLIEPEPELLYNSKKISDPSSYFSGDFANMNFRLYAQDIDQYPDTYFDIVLVDGRARPSCLFHAIKKIKKGGYLIVDNSERLHYQEAIRLLKDNDWKRKDFYGPVPFTHSVFNTTSFFKKK